MAILPLLSQPTVKIVERLLATQSLPHPRQSSYMEQPLPESAPAHLPAQAAVNGLAESLPAEPQAPSATDQVTATRSAIKEVAQILFAALILALVVQLFLAQATVVYGYSMMPSLSPTDRLVIEKVTYQFGEPERNDIVVLDLPQMPELLIKRLVGLPGDTIAVDHERLYINGTPVEGSMGEVPDTLSFGPIHLGEAEYFVMGDNRFHSNDSRSFGSVSEKAIVGRAWMRYWPIQKFQVFD
jgi:signal peptidase I